MLRLLGETYRKWTEDRAPKLAAALAYYSVFSLAPLLLIAVGLAGLVLGEDDARARIVEQTTAILGPRTAEAVERLMGEAGARREASVASTIAGFASLLIGAVGVLAQLKDALNAVWDVRPSGKSGWAGFVRQYLLNVALVIATGFLLLVSLVATAALGAVTSTARGWIAGPSFLWFLVDGLAGFAMTVAIFCLIFRVIPDADVRWRDAISGAVFTAALFTAGRLALGLYLGREAGDSVYDAAGSILALLLWATIPHSWCCLALNSRMSMRVGDLAPALELPTAIGERRSLAEFRGKPAVISFLGPAHCLFCRAHVIRAIQAQADFQKAGAEVVFVAYHDPEDLTSRMLRDLNLPFHLLLDPSREAYERWGLGRAGLKVLFSPGLYFAFARLKMTRPPDLGTMPGPHQMGGDFIVNREGRLAFVNRLRSFHDRAPIDRLLQVLTTA